MTAKNKVVNEKGLRLQLGAGGLYSGMWSDPLSYRHILSTNHAFSRGRLAGFEPATRGLEVRRNIARDRNGGASGDTVMIWEDLIALRSQ